ncbi:MAG: 3-dehydroquinate synthase [Bryobacteraceae bacterium]
MPSYEVKTGQQTYAAVVERGVLSRLETFVPAGAGQVFVTSTPDVWELHGKRIEAGMNGRPFHVLFFAGGEDKKRFSSVEKLAEEMVRAGGDRSSVVLAFGGGILTDVSGFLAAIFMRGIPVIQIPTTLLAQVDAAVGGKTGVNLIAGKNLIGSFHQPLSVLIDPDVLKTLPEREYRAGLFEVVKHGVIASPELFDLMGNRSADLLAHESSAVDYIISESVRIKAEVVSADEKESGLRRILNFGHTIGHTLEAETSYSRFLHGEAVAFGMNAATHLASMMGLLSDIDRDAVLRAVSLYGPIPSLEGISASSLVARTNSDKKTIHGKVHFVLPDRIGHVQVVSGIAPTLVQSAVEAALA